jgi:hypothetical protein
VPASGVGPRAVVESWSALAQRTGSHRPSCWPCFNLTLALSMTTLTFLVFVASERDRCGVACDGRTRLLTADSGDAVADLSYLLAERKTHRPGPGSEGTREAFATIEANLAAAIPNPRSVAEVAAREAARQAVASQSGEAQQWRYGGLDWVRSAIPAFLTGSNRKRKRRAMSAPIAGTMPTPLTAGSICLPAVVQGDGDPHADGERRLYDAYTYCTDQDPLTVDRGLSDYVVSHSKAGGQQKAEGNAVGMRQHGRSSLDDADVESPAAMMSALLQGYHELAATWAEASPSSPTAAAALPSARAGRPQAQRLPALIVTGPGTSSAVVGLALALARRPTTEHVATAVAAKLGLMDPNQKHHAGATEVAALDTVLETIAPSVPLTAVNLAVEPDPDTHRGLVRTQQEAVRVAFDSRPMSAKRSDDGRVDANAYTTVATNALAPSPSSVQFYLQHPPPSRQNEVATTPRGSLGSFPRYGSAPADNPKDEALTAQFHCWIDGNASVGCSPSANLKRAGSYPSPRVITLSDSIKRMYPFRASHESPRSPSIAPTVSIIDVAGLAEPVTSASSATPLLGLFQTQRHGVGAVLAHLVDITIATRNATRNTSAAASPSTTYASSAGHSAVFVLRPLSRPRLLVVGDEASVGTLERTAAAVADLLCSAHGRGVVLVGTGPCGGAPLCAPDETSGHGRLSPSSGVVERALQSQRATPCVIYASTPDSNASRILTTPSVRLRLRARMKAAWHAELKVVEVFGPEAWKRLQSGVGRTVGDGVSPLAAHLAQASPRLAPQSDTVGAGGSSGSDWTTTALQWSVLAAACLVGLVLLRGVCRNFCRK